MFFGHVMLVATAISCASAAIGALTSSDRAFILKEHNDFRARQPARYMPDMRWDTNLASQAQAWTDACRYGHQWTQPWGENIGYVYGMKTNVDAIKFIFDKWVAEEKYNTNGNFDCCGPKGMSCCHFTQVIWAGTTRIGCGLTNCPNLGPSAYLACYYQPKGNMIMNGKMVPYVKS